MSNITNFRENEMKLCATIVFLYFDFMTKSKLPMQKYMLLLVMGLLPLTMYAQSKKPALIPVLIIDGFSNHDWKQTTKMIRGILEESKLFKVDVSTLPSTPDSIQMGS